eukprot:3157918-Prymnesium_polylepis.1
MLLKRSRLRCYGRDPVSYRLGLRSAMGCSRTSTRPCRLQPSMAGYWDALLAPDGAGRARRELASYVLRQVSPLSAHHFRALLERHYL